MNRTSIGSVFFVAVWWASPSTIVMRSSTPALLKFSRATADPPGVDVVGVEVAAGLAQGHREPEPRLAGGRAQLDDPPGVDRLGELAEQAAVGGRDVGVAAPLAGLVEGLQDLLLAVVLRQRGLRQVAAGLGRPGAASAPALLGLFRLALGAGLLRRAELGQDGGPDHRGDRDCDCRSFMVDPPDGDTSSGVRLATRPVAQWTSAISRRGLAAISPEIFFIQVLDMHDPGGRRVDLGRRTRRHDRRRTPGAAGSPGRRGPGCPGGWARTARARMAARSDRVVARINRFMGVAPTGKPGNS